MDSYGSKETWVKKFKDLSDFVAAEGSQLGPTEWLEVTQERVNLFADATEDHQWIHVDPARAADRRDALCRCTVHRRRPHLVSEAQYRLTASTGDGAATDPA